MKKFTEVKSMKNVPAIMSIRFEDSVVMEDDKLFIRSDKLPYQIVNNWNIVKNTLLELIEKQDKQFGCESLLGLKWFWLRKD